MRTIWRITGCVLLSLAAGCANTSPARVAQSTTPTMTIPTTPWPTSISPTVTSTIETTTTEVTTVPLPSSSQPPKAKKLPATFNRAEDWVVHMALYFFPELESRKNELVRRAPDTINCGSVTINSADAYDQPGLIWCGKPTARKFYFSHATLERLRLNDEPAGQAMIIRALAAFALNPEGVPGPLSDQALAKKAGELVKDQVCRGRATLEEAQALAPGFRAQSNTFLQALGSCK